ncbi:hypothetical protein SAMN05414139_05265 [Burkholderia sp. D7]|nr:hypothetical protein SAMN05414139_05265 [Burkholderia sp. D7]
MLSKITGRDRLRNHGGPGRILKVLDELRTDFGIAYAALDTDARSQSLRRCVMHAGFSYLNAASDCLNCEVRHLPNLRTYIDELADTAEAVGLSISVVPCSFDEESVYALHLYTIVGNPGLIDLTHPRKTKKALRKIVAVRDRLAHPRRSSELEITLGDLRRCAHVIGWVHARLHRLLASSSHDPRGE